MGDVPSDPALVPPPENRKDIPERYRAQYTTPLKAEVIAGQPNTADFELAE